MNRRTIILLAALIALSGSITTTAISITERNQQLRGYEDATRDYPMPYWQPRLGANVEMRQYSDAELIRQLDEMRAAGMHWVRQFVYWDEIEQSPGEFDWETLDRIVLPIQEYPDLKIVLVLMNSPTWAQKPNIEIQSSAPPRDTGDFARFAAAVAERYQHIVHNYQIWDEPNLTEAWGNQRPVPAAYLALLADAYNAIHAADSSATVIMAALAPTTETGPDNISDILYLDMLYKLGASRYMDAVAAKPYGFDTPPSDRTVRSDTLNFSRIIAIRELMKQYGDGGKALWASNWGWNALPPDWSGPSSIWGSVTQDEQLAFTLAALDRAEREWPWLGPMILQHWQPDVPRDDPIWGFSLKSPSGTNTRLLQAFISRPVATAAGNGLFHPANPFARYSGLWTFGPLGADIGWLERSDSRLEFDFYGSDLALLVREGNYTAFLYTNIDSNPDIANALPQDSNGNAYLFLGSDSQGPELNLVSVARELEQRQHVLSLIADKGWDQWALAGFGVSSGNLSQPFNQQIVIGIITSIVSVLAVVANVGAIGWRSFFRPVNTNLDRLSEAQSLILGLIASIVLLLGMLLTWRDAVPALLRRDPLHLGIALLLSMGLAALQPPFVIVIIAIIFLFILICHRLETGLLLTLFWAPFFLFAVELYRFAFPIVEVTLLVTFAAWMLQLIYGWSLNWQMRNSYYPANWHGVIHKLKALDVVMLLWVIAASVSLLWAQRPNEAMTELRTVILEPAIFYLLLRQLMSAKFRLQLAGIFVISGLCAALIGLGLYFTGSAIIVAEGGAQRLAGIYGSPNNMALLLVRIVPFVLAWVLLEANRSKQLVAGIVLVILLITLLLTQSVGGLLLGLPAGIATVIFWSFGRKAFAPLFAMGGVLISTVFVLSRISARFADLLDISRGTNFLRLRLWESSIDIIRNHPLTGLGLDQFLYRFRGHYIKPDAIWDPDLSHPHNIVLDVWIRLGIAGVLLLMAMQYIFWRSLWHVWRNRLKLAPSHNIVFAGVAGAMAATLAHGSIDNSLFVIDLAFITSFLLAIAASVENIRAIDAKP